MSNSDFGIAGNNIFTKSLNILLPIAGAGVMYYYEYCETACSYINGTFMGIDLKVTGIIFMSMLLASAFVSGSLLGGAIKGLRTFMIASAIGAEIILIRFQVVNDIYCQFCLLFASCIFVLFMVNFTSMNKILMMASLAAGSIAFIFFFQGQVVPSFDLSF